MRILKAVGAWLKRRTSRVGAFLGAGLLSATASAQESSSNIDLSAASTAVNEMATAVKGFFTGSLLDAILVIMGAGFVIWVVFLGARFVKRGGKSAA